MSQYMTFVAMKCDIYTPILSVSRISDLYQTLSEHVDCGDLTLIEDEVLVDEIRMKKDYIWDLSKDVAAIEANKRDVGGWKNTISEKMESIHEYEELKREVEERIETARETIVQLQMLRGIIDELKNYSDYTNEETGLYAGIDIDYEM